MLGRHFYDKLRSICPHDVIIIMTVWIPLAGRTWWQNALLRLPKGHHSLWWQKGFQPASHKMLSFIWPYNYIWWQLECFPLAHGTSCNDRVPPICPYDVMWWQPICLYDVMWWQSICPYDVIRWQLTHLSLQRYVITTHLSSQHYVITTHLAIRRTKCFPLAPRTSYTRPWNVIRWQKVVPTCP